VRGVAGTALSWRGQFGLTLIPLAALPLLSRLLEEPDRFERIWGGPVARRRAAAAASWAVPQPPCDGGSG
jgi:hypothetical protein